MMRTKRRGWAPVEVNLGGERYSVDADGRVYWHCRPRAGLAYGGRRRVRDRNRVRLVHDAVKREVAKRKGEAQRPKWRTVTVRRTWRERLFGRPWSPWVAMRKERVAV
jgi:hypothetical protein